MQPYGPDDEHVSQMQLYDIQLQAPVVELGPLCVANTGLLKAKLRSTHTASVIRYYHVGVPATAHLLLLLVLQIKPALRSLWVPPIANMTSWSKGTSKLQGGQMGLPSSVIRAIICQSLLMLGRRSESQATVTQLCPMVQTRISVSSAQH